VVAELSKSWRIKLIVIRGRRAVVLLAKVSLNVLMAGSGSRDRQALLETRSTVSTCYRGVALSGMFLMYDVQRGITRW
jgi:hypothetical protein